MKKDSKERERFEAAMLKLFRAPKSVATKKKPKKGKA